MDIRKDFHWINEGEIVIEENRITMTAPALTVLETGEKGHFAPGEKGQF